MARPAGKYAAVPSPCMARQKVIVGMLVANPAYSVQTRVQAMPITYTCDPPYTSTARPKSSRNAETSIDVMAVGHIIDLAERLNSCMRAGIKAKKPLVMYSSKICDDEMATISVASLQAKVERLGHQRAPLSVGCDSSTTISCGGELSMATMVQIVVKLPG